MDNMQKAINEFTERVGLPDKAIDIDSIPWVPQGERVWFKPLRFDLQRGSWVNILKVQKGGVLNRHRHSGGQVMAYTIQGSWRYLERPWVAKAGTFVYEPPGDIHTLVVDDGEEMMTLFILDGTIQYIDDNDNVISQDDVFSKYKRYLDYCEQAGIPVVDLVY